MKSQNKKSWKPKEGWFARRKKGKKDVVCSTRKIVFTALDFGQTNFYENVAIAFQFCGNLFSMAWSLPRSSNSRNRIWEKMHIKLHSRRDLVHDSELESLARQIRILDIGMELTFDFWYFSFMWKSLTCKNKIYTLQKFCFCSSRNRIYISNLSHWLNFDRKNKN